MSDKVKKPDIEKARLYLLAYDTARVHLNIITDPTGKTFSRQLTLEEAKELAEKLVAWAISHD